jgi:hypothetical protein
MSGFTFTYKWQEIDRELIASDRPPAKTRFIGVPATKGGNIYE